MNRKAAGILVVGIVAAVLAWRYGVGRGDRYDYAAAFENLPEDTGATPDLDVRAFAGQPRANAEAVLGQPQSCERALDSERCGYANGVEVIYIDGRADWLTVPLGYGRHPLDAATLARLGLPVTEPTQSDAQNEAQRLVWRDLAGLREVQMIGDANGALFARIKVRHE
ncbi:hypothetical protein AAG565_13330 [Fontimonas sp. SYSU GA230001]|uniref:hypothetical protein n=1 Tax=Fontimonas sp. SYSU GA230001 TaxID=3142450 RepID=UPI0032B39C4B